MIKLTQSPSAARQLGADLPQLLGLGQIVALLTARMRAENAVSRVFPVPAALARLHGQSQRKGPLRRPLAEWLLSLG